VEFTLNISGNGIVTTTYKVSKVPATLSDANLSEVGIAYVLAPGVESVSWLRDGLYSAYPDDHIGRNEGTALKVRKGASENPDQYGVKPSWSWKDDMKNFFVFASSSRNDGLATNDFKSMRENIRYYNVKFAGTKGMVSVESTGRDAARIEHVSDNGSAVDDRHSSIKFYTAGGSPVTPGSNTNGWKTYDDAADYNTTETFSNMNGAYCEAVFTGVGVRFIGTTQQNSSKANIYIDDKFVTTIDAHTSKKRHQQVNYSVDSLAYGLHTIKIETVAETYRPNEKISCIVVDAFEPIISHEMKNRLIIDRQWNYKELAWGNYTGASGKLAEDSTGSVTIRLSAAQ
jgi:hypothetical protein